MLTITFGCSDCGGSVRINSDRSDRLIFDLVASDYDSSRPSFDASLVDWACEQAAMGSGCHVLEIGAATGQLTVPLAERGLRVTALEPGDSLRGLLEEKIGHRDTVEIVGNTFEEYVSHEQFDAIFAANALHWIDPDVAYRKSHELVKSGGSMVLMWNFPIVDAATQSDLNELVFKQDFPDFVRDSDSFEESTAAELAKGRAEIESSGYFLPTKWKMIREVRSLDPGTYIRLLYSYANAAKLTKTARSELGLRVRECLNRIGLATIEMTNWVYCCVASRVTVQAER